MRAGWPPVSATLREAPVGMLEVIASGARPSVDAAFDHGLHEFWAAHGLPELAKPLAPDEQPLVKLVVVRDPAGVLLGGGRVHQHHARCGFPVESSLRHFAGVRSRVRDFPAADTVEIAALWTTASAARAGIPRLLVQACLATAKSMAKRTAFTVSHQRFDPVLRAAGLVPLAEVAEVPFPSPSYRTRIYTTELAKLAGATKQDREIIGTIVESLGAGAEPMPLHELAAIEHGMPSWTVRRRTGRMRQVA